MRQMTEHLQAYSISEFHYSVDFEELSKCFLHGLPEALSRTLTRLAPLNRSIKNTQTTFHRIWLPFSGALEPGRCWKP